ncbi:MAG TPA: Ig-like domain-containing protein, partial [Geobacteraceae bacterium]
MINLVRSGFFVLLLLAGCGWDGTPTRSNDFTPLTSIVIVATPPTIAAHTSTRLAVIGNFSGQFTRDVTDQATWSSDAPTVAEFATAAEPNRVTGRAPGSAILTATVGSVSSTFALTVSSATVTALAITPADPSIAKGLNTQFDVSGTFSDATTQDLTFDANWVSSDPGVATVSDAVGSKGLVQTLAAGTSTITATFDGISGTTLLTVTQPVLQSITVTPANPSILAISSVNFRAVGNFSDGSVADITSLASWSSTSSGVATISAGGAAKTLAQGTATINATLDGVTGASNI